MDKKEIWTKVKTFFKKNGYYFLIVLCIGAVATMVGVAVTQSKTDTNANVSVDGPADVVDDDDKTPDNGDEQKPAETTTFAAPSTGTVTNDYTASSVFYNQSLGKYETHEAIDFVSDSDKNVYASADGTVIEADYNILDGYYVVIEHEDSITTKYCSLAAEVPVEVGDTVKGGDVIGEMSDSMGSEYLDGVHLHFEVYRDGELINPTEVLVYDEK